MKIGTSYRQERGALRAFPGLAAPKGAIIICAYLVGMAGIAAGAFAMRNPSGHDLTVNIPAAVTDMADSLPQPPAEALKDMRPTFAIKVRPVGTAPETPRLASLAPADTRLDETLLSPLSRIFLGRPSVIPPERPAQDGVPETETTETGTTGAAEDGILSASLRPRLRPADLDKPRAVTAESLQLASLAAAETTDDAPPPAETASVPATPRITASQGTCPSRLARSFPRRPGSAPGAQAFMASVRGIDGVKRDRHVAREILRGNMPDFLHDLVPVTISGRTSDGTKARITICVTPDYLALGSDRDYVRVPLGLAAASRIAEQFDMILPTPQMVDMIYRAAALRLAPQPMSPGPQMTSTAYFVRHNATVEAQRKNAGAAPGTLISGHKKDVVLTSRLASHRGRVAIYGWHRRNGRPIQPLSTVHGAGYADYSHGVRLVSRTAFLNGRSADLRSLMADPRYAGLLSDEGPVGLTVLASN